MRRTSATYRLRSGRSESKCLSWWELQKPGVLHAHVVLPMGDAEERWWSRAYVHAWEKIAAGFWFGYVDRWESIKGKSQASERVGRYVAGYTLRGDGKLPLERAGSGSTDAGADVPYQPAADGNQQSDDAQRSAQPAHQRSAAREMSLAEADQDELVATLWFRLRLVKAEQRGAAVALILEDLPEEARAP